VGRRWGRGVGDGLGGGVGDCHLGIDARFDASPYREAAAKGIRRGEAFWIPDTNASTIRALEKRAVPSPEPTAWTTGHSEHRSGCAASAGKCELS